MSETGNPRRWELWEKMEIVNFWNNFQKKEAMEETGNNFGCQRPTQMFVKPFNVGSKTALSGSEYVLSDI